MFDCSKSPVTTITLTSHTEDKWLSNPPKCSCLSLCCLSIHFIHVCVCVCVFVHVWSKLLDKQTFFIYIIIAKQECCQGIVFLTQDKQVHKPIKKL